MSAEPTSPPKAAARKIRRGEVVLLGFTGAAILGIFGIFFAINASSEVWIVNALDVPVDVLVDGSKVPVEAATKTGVRLRAGMRSVRVQRRTGELIEEAPFDVPGGYDVVVYNVLGAAPLYSAQVEYGSSYGTPPEPTFFGGQRAISRDGVDYVFTEPPSSISIKSGESKTRTRFDLVPGGWLTTASYLDQQKHDPAATAELCRAVARAEPEDQKALGYARHFTQLALGIDGQLRFLREELARRPDDAEAQLAHASMMRMAGRGEEIRAAYRPRFEADPTNAVLGSVLLRVESFDEAKKISEALIARDPQGQLARQGAAQLAFSSHDWARSAELYASLDGNGHEREYLEDHVVALMAQRKAPEALALVGRTLAASATPDLPTSLLYARIAAIPASGTPLVAPTLYLDKAVEKSGIEGQLWVKLQLGGSVGDSEIVQVKDDMFRRSLEIQRDGASDPKLAWTSASVAGAPALARLPPTVALLLAAEFARAGDADLADRILANHNEYGLPRAILLDYALSGAEHPDLFRLGPEWRAALDLVRARRQEELGIPAKAIYEAAERGDYLHGIVSHARDKWPPPARTRGVVSDLTGGVVGGVVGKPAKASRDEVRGGLRLKGSSDIESPSRQVVFKKSG